MKTKLFLSTVVLLAVASGSARAEPKEFEDVPLNSWTYPALEKLQEVSPVDGVKKPPFRRVMVRYEFAVAMARWMNVHAKDSNLPQELQARDIATALGYEFGHEIQLVNNSNPMLDLRELQLLDQKRSSMSPTDWFEMWLNNHLLLETRIEAPPRGPASFLHRRAFALYR